MLGKSDLVTRVVYTHILVLAAVAEVDAGVGRSVGCALSGKVHEIIKDKPEGK